MKNSFYNTLIGGELQFYNTINVKVQELGGNIIYAENAMNIFKDKITHSLQTVENLKPREPSGLAEKEMEKILNDRNQILLKNGFERAWLPDLSITEIRKAQSELLVSELNYYKHFLINDASSLDKGFSPELKETEYGRMIIKGFDNTGSFVVSIKEIKDKQIADKTAYIAQIVENNLLLPDFEKEEIDTQSKLFSLVFELKKQFAEPPKDRTRAILEFMEYLENYVLPQY